MATRQLDGFLQRLRAVTLQHEASGVSDAQLLESFISRKDEAAFAALLRRHGPMVWGVCRRVLGQVHDAEDAFQVTFLVLVRKAAAIVPRAMVGNWLYGVAYRTAMKARATSIKRRTKEKLIRAMPETPAQQDAHCDLVSLLDQELNRLPDKYRAAVVLCDLQRKTHKEAARQLAWPVGTLSTRLVRARALLAQRLSRHGLTVSGGTLAMMLARAQNASASVPSSVVYSTIKAATGFAAGKATAGVISANVAALTEGVLKAMLLTKLKSGMAVLLVLSLIAIPATALTYHAMAGEEPKQDQNVQAEPPLKDRKALEEDLRRLQAEVQRLQKDIDELKKRSQPQPPDAQASNTKLVIRVYVAAGLIGQVTEKGELPLVRVITRTIEPQSWDTSGGPGSVEYLPEVASLIIRQSPEVHKQVQELLDMLRKTKADQEKKADEEDDKRKLQ